MLAELISQLALYAQHPRWIYEVSQRHYRCDDWDEIINPAPQLELSIGSDPFCLTPGAKFSVRVRIFWLPRQPSRPISRLSTDGSRTLGSHIFAMALGITGCWVAVLPNSWRSRPPLADRIWFWAASLRTRSTMRSQMYSRERYRIQFRDTRLSGSLAAIWVLTIAYLFTLATHGSEAQLDTDLWCPLCPRHRTDR